MISRCLAEIARLEAIFSLHRPDSELVRLNRDGRLAKPSHDLRLVLADSQRIAELSGGAFDVTVQPLWQLYAQHFRSHPGDLLGPEKADLETALELIDFRQLDLSGGAIGLRRPGMAVTLNGIAQGYITDRVADLLRAHGFAQVLVQLGETRALAPPRPDRPWRIGVPGGSRTIELANRALATSSGTATRFEPSGRHHHLFDPRTGTSVSRYASVSVLAETAAAADALSTALAILPTSAARDLLQAAGGISATYAMPDGTQRSIEL
jgi:thiamine biosynthesis lipoprotein